MRTFTIKLSLVFYLLLGSFQIAHAGFLFGGWKNNRPFGPANNFYAELLTSDHPEVIGGNLYFQPVPGTPHISGVVPVDLGFALHYERNGASGKYAKPQDKRGVQILHNFPSLNNDWERVAEIDPKKEDRKPLEKRWSGLLSAYFKPGELPVGLHRFKLNYGWDQPPIWIYIQISPLTYRQMQEIENGAATKSLPDDPALLPDDNGVKEEKAEDRPLEKAPAPISQPMDEPGEKEIEKVQPSEIEDNFDPSEEIAEQKEAVVAKSVAAESTKTVEYTVKYSGSVPPRLKWFINGKAADKIVWPKNGQTITQRFSLKDTIEIGVNANDSDSWVFFEAESGHGWLCVPRKTPRPTIVSRARR